MLFSKKKTRLLTHEVIFIYSLVQNGFFMFKLAPEISSVLYFFPMFISIFLTSLISLSKAIHFHHCCCYLNYILE